jgi:hypothetical protein
MKANWLLPALGGCLAALTVAAADKPAKPDHWKPTLAPVDEPLTNIGRNPCFILEPGYQLVFAGKEDGKQAELIITVLNETLDIGGVPTRIVEERESADGKLVEVSRNYFALGVQTTNLYYFGEDVDMYKDGEVTSHEGSWHEGKNGAKRGILLPGTLKVGDRYDPGAGARRRNGPRGERFSHPDAQDAGGHVQELPQDERNHAPRTGHGIQALRARRRFGTGRQPQARETRFRESKVTPCARPTC